MLVNSDYKFRINISTGCYPTKKPEKAWAVQYSSQDITLKDLEILQREGKAFCYNFKEYDESGLITAKQKTLANFKDTYIIFYDIDKMPKQMEDYISPLTFKPSLSYTTISNGKDGKFGYRLLYVFDEEISSIEEFDKYYYAIASANGFKQQVYPDGTKYEFDYRQVNQQYYGGGLSSITNRTDIIYSKSDFSNFVDNVILLKETIGVNSKSKKSTTQAKRKIDSFPDENNIAKQEEEKAYYSELENPFFNDLFSLPPKEFIEKNKESYIEDYKQSLSTALILSNDGKYWIYPENYQEVKRNWGIDSEGKKCIRKWPINSGRKKRLYITAQIMKFNNPSITREALIFNLVYERYYYYCNSDNNLGNKILIHIADSAMGHNFELSPCKHPRFSVNKEYWCNGNVSAQSAKNIIRKIIKEQEVLSVYDFNISVKENLEILKNLGIKVSKSRLYEIKKKYDDFPDEINIAKQEEEKAYYSELEK